MKENSRLPPRANQKFSFQGCGVQPKKKKRPLEYKGPKARIFIENEEEARLESDEASKQSRDMLNEIFLGYQQQKKEPTMLKQRHNSTQDLRLPPKSLMVRANEARTRLPIPESITRSYNHFADATKEKQQKAKRLERCQDFDSFSRAFKI